MFAKLSLALLSLTLSPAAFAASDGLEVKASCLLADQTTGRPVAFKSVALTEIGASLLLFETKAGLGYKIDRTTAGDGDNIQHLLFLSIVRGEETIAQTGVEFKPGTPFTVMLTQNPQVETLTCAGK